MSADDNNGTHHTRIRWQNGGIFSRASLWLADDHVLQITSSGVRERYQRFYLRDIRAIMITEAWTGMTCAVLFGIPVFLLFLGVIVSLASQRGFTNTTFVFTLLSICLCGMIFFLWRGRTAKVYVVTELQTTLLRSVARKWQARGLVGQLAPLINAAQADLVRAQPLAMEARMADAVDAAVSATASETPPQADGGAAPA